ncbi:hypothetical protein ACM66B_000490 [Microbotryomycetes sp. NB124-2]
MPSKLKKRGSSTKPAVDHQTPPRPKQHAAGGAAPPSPIALRTSSATPAKPEPTTTIATAALLNDTASVISSSARSERSSSIATAESSPVVPSSAAFVAPSPDSALALLRQRIENDEIARHHHSLHDHDTTPTKLRRKRPASEVDSLTGTEVGTSRKRDLPATDQPAATAEVSEDRAEIVSNSSVTAVDESEQQEPSTKLSSSAALLSGTQTQDLMTDVVRTAYDVAEHSLVLSWRLGKSCAVLPFRVASHVPIVGHFVPFGADSARRQSAVPQGQSCVGHDKAETGIMRQAVDLGGAFALASILIPLALASIIYTTLSSFLAARSKERVTSSSSS